VAIGFNAGLQCCCPPLRLPESVLSSAFDGVFEDGFHIHEETKLSPGHRLVEQSPVTTQGFLWELASGRSARLVSVIEEWSEKRSIVDLRS